MKDDEEDSTIGMKGAAAEIHATHGDSITWRVSAADAKALGR